MAGVVDVPRVAGFSDADAAVPPVWWMGDDGVPLIACGGCGLFHRLEGWAIADDGTVSPSVWHNEAQCGWHVFIRLLDWVPA
jgi:hypothetical protein